jgi:hypothetical protein
MAPGRYDLSTPLTARPFSPGHWGRLPKNTPVTQDSFRHYGTLNISEHDYMEDVLAPALHWCEVAWLAHS